MTDDLAALAAGLTKGQERVLRDAIETSDGRFLVISMFASGHAWPEGVVAYYSTYYSRLTPLGEQLRAHMKDNPK